jgi:FlaA1/EpsC-like NDP-sugar epimerase
LDIAQGAGLDRIYIIGAGFAGQSIAKEIKEKNVYGQIIAFLDDDNEKIGNSFEGIPVLGPIEKVLSILEPKTNDQALITIPSADQKRLRNIYDLLKKAQFPKIRILPRISHILEGQAHFVETRSVNPQDLLSREPIEIGLKQSLNYLRGKRVLITGAGGSIGSELARQLLHGGASRLYLFGHGENSIFRIEQELRLLQKGGVGEKATIVPIIGEMQDPNYFTLSSTKAQS